MRTSAPDFPVAPAPSVPRSRSTTRRTPRVARLKAVLAPLAPPPMTTTSAVSMAAIVTRGRPARGRRRKACLTGPVLRLHIVQRIQDAPSPVDLMAVPKLWSIGGTLRCPHAHTSGGCHEWPDPTRDAGRRGRNRGAVLPARGRACPDDVEARGRRRPGRRHLEVRPALLHVLERHPDLVQPVRQPDRAPSGR